MSDDAPDLSPAADEAAAAELALGLLDGAERAAALRRVLAEAGFAAEVEGWRRHFAALFAQFPETEPGETLLPRIEASLDGRFPVAASRGRLWPAVAALTSLAAAILLVLLLRPAALAPPVQPASQLAAAIVPTGAGEPLSAIYDARAGTLRLTAAALADTRHAAELWVIGGDGVPHSLGLLRDGAQTALTVAPADRARLGPAAVLAVSIEPLGGSPTGLPTGPVVAKGALATA
ncbi:anti-sigma factor [Sphingomonas sp.]|uniref:anti-sigma factor n=1 Tax=Sphingomonas sp. TaxID=28214 RepID=UPI003CC6BD22